jgi:reactive intermediate/imine deaminase
MTPAATPPLSPARRAGNLLFLSGQLPRQGDGTLVSGPIEAQTEQVIANVAEVLAGHGLGLADVVKATVWLTQAAHAPGFNRVYAQRFSAPYPARSTVVAALVADADIEMEVVALIPEPHDRPALAD